MISEPIKLSKFYELTFQGAKALITQLTWDRVPGKNKLRKFFLRDNWQNDIVSISVSSSGAKGGVFFLEADVLNRQALDTLGLTPAKHDQIWNQLIKDGLITAQGIKTAAGRAGTLPAQTLAYVNNVTKIRNLLTTSNRKRQFVVKGTEEPGRTLFAEYVLSRVGKAKIPKSLVLEVDPARPHDATNPSEGMVMLHLLGDPNKRNPNVDAQKYANSYAFLDDGQGTQNSCVSYLVVQKLIAGSMLPIKNDVNGDILDFLLEHNILIDEQSFATDTDFQATPAQDIVDLVNELKQKGCLSTGGVVDAQYQTKLNGLVKLNDKLAEITRIFKASRDVLDNHGLQFTQNSVDRIFDELDALMQQAGDSPLKQAFLALRARQKAAVQELEAILGTAETMINAGRVIFADLTIGNGDRFENMNSGNFFFIDKMSNKPGKVNYPIGCIDNDAFMHAFMPKRNAPVVEGFATVDDYVSGLLQDGTPELWGLNSAPPANYNPGPSAAVKQMMNVDGWFDRMFFTVFVVGMPKCVVKHFSAKFYDPTDSYPYNRSKQLEGWQDAKQRVKQGFCLALLEYQGIPLYEFRQVYVTLAEQYGQGANFDFVAFEVRDRYMREVQVDKSNWTVILPDFNTIKGTIVVDLKKRLGGAGLSRTIQNALASPQATAILSKYNITPEQILKLLNMLSLRDQENLIPCPFGLILDKNKKSVHFGDLSDEYKAHLAEKWNALKPKYQARMNAVICAILATLVVDYEKEIRHARFAHFFILDSLAYQEALKHADLFSSVKLYKDGGSSNKAAKRRLYLIEFGLNDYL